MFHQGGNTDVTAAKLSHRDSEVDVGGKPIVFVVGELRVFI
jgi:hypothetical protein